MKPKYNLGEIVVADLSVDKIVGYVLKIKEDDFGNFNGWYEIFAWPVPGYEPVA